MLTSLHAPYLWNNLQGFFFPLEKNNFHSSNTIWVKILRGIILGYLVRRQVHLSNFFRETTPLNALFGKDFYLDRQSNGNAAFIETLRNRVTGGLQGFSSLTSCFDMI